MAIKKCSLQIRDTDIYDEIYNVNLSFILHVGIYLLYNYKNSNRDYEYSKVFNKVSQDFITHQFCKLEMGILISA